MTDPTAISPALMVGMRAEQRVVDALKTLPTPWQYFHAVEWRNLRDSGETIGEADILVFHPNYGLVVFEVKAGAVNVKNGQWFYSSGQPMNYSPFTQARRNRFALIEKLKNRIGKDTTDTLTITHAVWFPDVVWQGVTVGTEAPSRSFIFDRVSLADPTNYLIKLFNEACSSPLAWSRPQITALKELLAPDCQQIVPLVGEIDLATRQLDTATHQQVQAFRLLRNQKRLLVEGSAGSGKTLLAVMLAKEHAALGKSVLVTCFNKNLAKHISDSLDSVPGITVATFHELVRMKAEEVGLEYKVPTDKTKQTDFFRETCPELLITAAEMGAARFDTVIVDEGADFAATWWIALEALGKDDFSWYCFYDTNQSIYHHGECWSPPFQGEPFILDANLRNTKPVGDLAVELGACAAPSEYRIQEGTQPVVLYSESFTEMAVQLKETLKTLIRKQHIRPEQITVLAPYKHTNSTSEWAQGLSEVSIAKGVSAPETGSVRVCTIQGFKGLESDVVVVVGLDANAWRHREWLYVGATRAKAHLVVLSLNQG